MQPNITVQSLPITAQCSPTASGQRQLIVELSTSCDDGIARAIVDIDDDTTDRRVAEIVQEHALALYAHELLEHIHVDGERAFDAHDHGGHLLLMPPPLRPVERAAYRRVRERIGLTRTVPVSVVIPADHSAIGENRRREKPVDIGVAEVVRRLNHPIFGDSPITAGSCSGHGETQPIISMANGEIWRGELIASETTSRSPHASGPIAIALARASHEKERSMRLAIPAWDGLSDGERADKCEGANLIVDFVLHACKGIADPSEVALAIRDFVDLPMFAGIAPGWAP